MKLSLFEYKKPPLIACVMTDTDVLTIHESSVIIADLIELRIDMFVDTSVEHVTTIFKTAKEKFKKPFISTVRDVREGGKKEFSDRFLLYEAVIPFSDFLDVEINSENLLQRVKGIITDRNLLIGSYHNFHLTPKDDFLENILIKGKGLGSDIVKIAVKAQDRDDLIRLLLFTLRHKDSGIITMCMGDEGVPSRIVAPIFGSLVAYGYINEPSAPGQLSISQLSDIFKLLNIS